MPVAALNIEETEMSDPHKTETLIKKLVAAQSLPSQFMTSAQQWYLPLCKHLVSLKNKKNSTLYVSINGCQGSGKSTMAMFIEHILSQVHGLTVANLSIDDFYLTRKERKHLASHIHPLLITRGVPGTHDVPLAVKTLKKLAGNHKQIPLVRFNKAIDDRADETTWAHIDGPVDIVILEGWCMGLTAQGKDDLYTPINELESHEDANGRWRNYVNEQLSDHYSDLFNLFDTSIMLKAPSFDCVYRWRSLQEEKLKASATTATRLMGPKELKRFIQHYQRLTEHALSTLPDTTDIVFKMNEQQSFVEVSGLEAT